MEILAAINEHVGYPGRMLSGSKTTYFDSHPDNLVFFNACIFNREREQIWWGDVDVSVDADQLQAAADDADEEFYLTREHPYRWDGLSRKEIKRELRNETILNPSLVCFRPPSKSRLLRLRSLIPRFPLG